MAKQKKLKTSFRLISGKYCLGDANNLFEPDIAKKVLKEVNRRTKKVLCDYCEKFDLYFFKISNTDFLYEYICGDNDLKIESRIFILTKNTKEGKVIGCKRFAAKRDFTIISDHSDGNCFLYFYYDDEPSPFLMYGENY